MIRSGPISPLWGLAEVAGFLALFFVTLWVLGPQLEVRPWAGPLVLVLLAGAAGLVLWLSPIVLHRDPPALRGWGAPPPPSKGVAAKAWPLYALLTGLGLVVVTILAIARGPEAMSRIAWQDLPWRLARYLVFAQVQAFMAFGFIMTRLRTGFAALPFEAARAPATVILATAGAFAALHMPNWPVVALTFSAGIGWAWAFYRHPSTLLVGVSHAVLGALTQVVLGLSTRIGPFYAHPEHFVFRQVVFDLAHLMGLRF